MYLQWTFHKGHIYTYVPMNILYKDSTLLCTNYLKVIKFQKQIFLILQKRTIFF